jgi:predicted Rdx family selenoprotein
VGENLVDENPLKGFMFAIARRTTIRVGASRKTAASTVSRQGAPMNAQELLQEIADYCRRTGLAESTFGRRAVNDGKLTSRLRNGGRITTETLDRIRSFMNAHRDIPT